MALLSVVIFMRKLSHSLSYVVIDGHKSRYNPRRESMQQNGEMICGTERLKGGDTGGPKRGPWSLTGVIQRCAVNSPAVCEHLFASQSDRTDENDMFV